MADGMATSGALIQRGMFGLPRPVQALDRRLEVPTSVPALSNRFAQLTFDPGMGEAALQPPLLRPVALRPQNPRQAGGPNRSNRNNRSNRARDEVEPTPGFTAVPAFVGPARRPRPHPSDKTPYTKSSKKVASCT